MKKIILGIAALTGLMVATAQTNQGDWMVGGNFRLNTSDNNSEISFTPSAGAFIVDNLALEGNFSLGYSKSGNNKYTTFGIGPFARYYFTTESQAVRPIIHGSFNYLSTKQKIGNVSSTNNGTNFFIGGGAAMFISKNVSIDALLGYDRTKYKNFSGSGGFAFNVGFQVYLLKDQVEKVTGKK
ncbi:MAG: outer membrane beta-barrel protein [Chitinophagaceae bacterium]|nr:outer membrane beta-barrel protein [Chitinophagaceae bacterium]